MKLKLAVFYFTVFCVTLAAVTVGVICVLPSLSIERTFVSDFSLETGGYELQNMTVWGKDEGSFMQFERFEELCAEAVFDKKMVELYPETGHFSTADEEGTPFVGYLQDGTYALKNAYAVFEKGGECYTHLISVVDDKTGGCLLVQRQFKAQSSDSEAFAKILYSLEFTK